ncbi:MAG: hypothetical protein EU548_07580 [Promethearchaeota archaeon]|nr:MAG: hypothetical protein EU548_07580 [Candidatus Lokiarchaeota archaeon]
MSEEEAENTLIFVFNADSGGAWAALKDSLHKTFRKSTYECNLCSVTYGFFGMKKEWKSFVNDLDVPVEYMKRDKFKFEFLHRDEFQEKYKIKDAKFPSAYVETPNELKLFISQEEMNAVKDIPELEELVKQKLEKFNL